MFIHFPFNTWPKPPLPNTSFDIEIFSKGITEIFFNFKSLTNFWKFFETFEYCAESEKSSCSELRKFYFSEILMFDDSIKFI